MLFSLFGVCNLKFAFLLLLLIILFIFFLRLFLKSNGKSNKKSIQKNDTLSETEWIKKSNTNQINNFKNDMEKISKEWNYILKLIENNIQEIYKKREELNFNKENIQRKAKNIQKIMDELLVNYNKNSSNILKNEYIKHSMELEKLQNEIQTIEKQIIEYNDVLQILVEKNNSVQLEFDSFKQSYSHEISKTEIFEKINLISNEFDRLKTVEYQKFLTSLAIYKSENILEKNDDFNGSLLRCGKEKQHIDKMNENLAFENLFFGSGTEDKKQSQKTVDHLFK